MSVTVAKLTTAPNDVNKTESQANQDAVTVTQNGSNVIVSADLAALNSFESTDSGQGEGKWIGLDVNTGLDTIVGAQWNGYTLTAQDAAEAISVNLNSGHIIFWAKAEDLASNPRTITISKEGYEDAVFTVSFTDTHTGG